MLESKVENYLVKAVEKAGGKCWKWNSASLVGVPDRIVLLNSNVVFVELKRPGAKPRESQIDVHQMMAKRGVGVIIIDTLKGCDALVSECLKNKGHGGW